MADETYCGSGCYGEAKKHGRPVRTVTINGKEMRLCGLCESRAREGLVHYVPSNGTEWMIFLSRCEDCRHCSEHPDHGYQTCSWGILDRISEAGFEPDDSNKAWHDPANITRFDVNGRLLCPARCLRFTGKTDGDGALRDPPPKDCEGQLTFGDIDVPVERLPQRAEVAR